MALGLSMSGGQCGLPVPPDANQTHFLGLDGLSSGQDRAHLDGAKARTWYPSRDGDGLVQVLGFDQILATQLLLGFGKRAVGDDRLGVPDANRGCGGSRLEGIPAEIVAAVPDFLRE